MPTYAVRSKNGELLDVVNAGSVATARIEASKALLDVHMATTEEIVEFAKSGRDVRTVSKSPREKAPKEDPNLPDLEDHIRQEQAAGVAESEAAAEAAAEAAIESLQSDAALHQEEPAGFDFP